MCVIDEQEVIRKFVEIEVKIDTKYEIECWDIGSIQSIETNLEISEPGNGRMDVRHPRHRRIHLIAISEEFRHYSAFFRGIVCLAF